jgi:hypothetical protein
MIQDLLIPNYEDEYDDIPYDLIYTSSTNIPTRKDLINGDTVPKKTCSNEMCLRINELCGNSKYVCLFLFSVVASTVGILYIIIYTK